MLCPKCGGDTGVVDTRPTANNTIRRRRTCIACGHRLTTFETIADSNPGSDAERMLRQAAKLRDIAKRIELILNPENPDG